MQYLLSIYTEEREPDPADEGMQAMLDAYWAYDEAVKQAGVHIAGEALQPSVTATTVRVRDDERVLTDGPFAETKEQLAGFYLLECRDLDEALEWAAKCPGSWHGTIEVRAIHDFAQDGAEQAEAASAGS